MTVAGGASPFSTMTTRRRVSSARAGGCTASSVVALSSPRTLFACAYAAKAGISVAGETKTASHEIG
jgi:hypothetical protein